MMKYCFNDKARLCKTTVEATVGHLFTRLATVPDMTDIDELITGVTAAYGEVVARDPWLPPLVMREVLLPEGRLRKTFAERFAGRAAPVLVAAFDAARERGEMRDDIEPSVAALGLVALAVFPHLARPIVREVFGLDPAGVDRERVVEQIGRLYAGGVKRPETSGCARSRLFCRCRPPPLRVSASAWTDATAGEQKAGKATSISLYADPRRPRRTASGSFLITSR
jgi:AcrR family transcriptional regulator